MKKNKLLITVLKVAEIAKAIILLLMALVVVSIFLKAIQPELLQNANIYLNEGGFFNIAFSSVSADDDAAGTLGFSFGAYTVSEEETGITMDQLTWTSFIFNILQMLLVLFLYFLIVKELIKIILSIKDLNTFQEHNSHSFRRFGLIFLGLFFIQAFTFIATSEFFTFLFTIHLTPLFLMLGSFILAEIFKEGNILLQENQLTI